MSDQIPTTSPTRTESDSFGEIHVPFDCYWGAQTQRCLENFPIGIEKMPTALIHALGMQKRAAAQANVALGVLDTHIGDVIERAATEVSEGLLDDHFPLPVWQTGSGTQTNMNANEVIANRASELLGGLRGNKELVHPNDHVNLSQSSNDTIPTAIHIAAVIETETNLVPALIDLKTALSNLATRTAHEVKIGRTHTQDAVFITLGQEISGYVRQVERGLERIKRSLSELYILAQGGTAVGTGLNALDGFAEIFVTRICAITGQPFVTSVNKFEAIATQDALVEFSGTLNTLAVSLTKIANDLRLLSSGPNAGFGEINLPAMEPGSSIMPGKVNPTQIEALTMVCAQVMGNHTTITFAGSQGQFELNTYRPVAAYNLLQSIRLLADSTRSFSKRCVIGITVNSDRLREMVEVSPMLVTALTPHIGYDASARIAKTAADENLTIRETVLKIGLASAEDFDRWTRIDVLLGRSPTGDD